MDSATMTARTAIRDADLLERLVAEEAKGGPFLRHVVAGLAADQERRDAERAREGAMIEAGSRLPHVARRRAAVRAVFENAAPTPRDMRHIHSVLAVCGLPYDRRPATERVHERRQGQMSLRVEAGSLMRPDGTWEEQPLPHGPKARLIFLHLCSEAVRTKERTVEVGETLSAFMRDLGFQVTGGRNGTLRLFKEQINALAACSIRVGTFDGTRATTTQFAPFREVDVWMGADPDQRSLWPSTVTFSHEFHESLAKHALPVNASAVRAFAGSARKLDLYFWLGYRLHGLRQPLHISWKALGEQFGGGFKRERAFRAQMEDDLAALREVFPALPVTLGPDGLRLDPCPSETLALPARAPAAPVAKRARPRG